MLEKHSQTMKELSKLFERKTFIQVLERLQYIQNTTIFTTRSITQDVPVGKVKQRLKPSCARFIFSYELVFCCHKEDI